MGSHYDGQRRAGVPSLQLPPYPIVFFCSFGSYFVLLFFRMYTSLTRARSRVTYSRRSRLWEHNPIRLYRGHVSDSFDDCVTKAQDLYPCRFASNTCIYRRNLRYREVIYSQRPFRKMSINGIINNKQHRVQERSTNSVQVYTSVGGLRTVTERSRPRFTIASEVGGTQQLEASSKEAKMPVISGRTVGFPSQQFSMSSQTSSERPRISRFSGRGGRSPLTIHPGTRWRWTCANGTS